MIYRNDSNFILEKSAVCLGKFDGLHIGHKELIKQVISLKEKGLNAVVFSFLMNPRQLYEGQKLKQIYSEEEKKEILRELGVDFFISYPFDKTMFAMEPERFIRDVLVRQLDTRAIIVGSDFRFGHNRKGDTALLKKLSGTYGYEVKSFEKVKWEGDIVSSTRIRACIQKGEMEQANRMLGQPYFIKGEVLHGRRLGRTLGMPTINITPEDVKVLPPNGVYASKTWIDDTGYAGISNIGVKPTVGAEKKRLMETFIFDYCADLYGKNLKVELYAFERAEQKFASLEELKEQMQLDTAFGRDFFQHKSGIRPTVHAASQKTD